MTALLKASAALHAAGLATVALAPSSWPWVVAACVADHAAIYGAALWPRSRLLGDNLVRLGPDAAARGEVAVSFDDGPDPDVTPRVLDLLEARGARASFFLVGARAVAHPEVVRAIVRRGHRVENHTWSHSHAFSVLPPGAVGREIDRAQREIGALAGRAPRWFRAPAGLRPPWLDPQLRRRGISLASWTRRGFDAVDTNASRVAARLTRGLRAGDVLVLHDGPGHRVVLDALPRVLDAIDRAGLRAVPLP
ncbi:MAG TPA: polysaccharide deacetylase family protein [Candidatus Polarisedimenticolaceae bacterium]